MIQSRIVGLLKLEVASSGNLRTEKTNHPTTGTSYPFKTLLSKKNVLYDQLILYKIHTPISLSPRTITSGKKEIAK